LSQIAEMDPISARFQAKRLDKAGLLCPNHTRRLDTLKGVVGEMARIYRSIINGKISSAEGLRLIFALREIRCGLEAVNAAEVAADEAEAAAAAAAAAQTAPSPATIVIKTIPEGHYWQSDGSYAPMTDEMMRRLEPPPQIDKPLLELQPRSSEEARLLVELDGLSDEQLKERAVRCGLDLSLLNSSPSTSAD
jgi:hypothetical protein